MAGGRTRGEGDELARDQKHRRRNEWCGLHFAKQSGQRDLYEEFRDGITPLEPLIDRLAEGAGPPFSVFVLRPLDEPFVLVVLAIERDGLFAETIRDTYDVG